MLKRLHLQNFTVFADAEFEFGPGLNVLVGANGTGKTHVLKAGYSVLYNLVSRQKIRRGDYAQSNEDGANNGSWILDDKIRHVFRPVPFRVNALTRRDDSLGEREIGMEIAVELPGVKVKSYARGSLSEPALPATLLFTPILIPAKEVLTSGWLLSLYDRREIPIDETYPDLLRQLSGPPLRNPEPYYIVNKLQNLIGGKVEEEFGQFYLAAENQPRLEMNLVAEGIRKFATLYKLLANGTLTPETTLFWDEPEANLNPVLLKELAAVLTEMAQAGFQIMLATHSLFLMKELHILAQKFKQPVRFFGLYAGEQGDVQVETAADFVQLQHVAALDAELTQTFDFDEALDQEYAAGT